MSLTEHRRAVADQPERSSTPTQPPRLTGRLSPEHYEPARVPAAVRRYASVPDTLTVGSPGKVGLLELAFERRGGRTELTDRYQKSPLQIMRPLYFDPARPDLPVTQLMSTGGGIIQGDRLRMDISCGPDSAVHITTQEATKVHRMEYDYATQMVNLHAGPGSYLEYLPDPTILFAQARFYQHTVVTADPTATVLASETVYVGRLARGERNGYHVFASDFELRRPDGELLAVDTMRLQPPVSAVTGPAVLGGHDVMTTFYVVSPLQPAALIADTLHEALAEAYPWAGISVLPQDCGAWVRLLGSDPRQISAALRTAWDAVRRLLIGVPAPSLRKS